MSKFLVFLISLLIGIILFVWIFKSIGWEEIKKFFVVFTFWEGVLILILTLGKFLTATWKWKEILKAEGVNLPFLKLFNIYLSGSSIAYFFPTAFLAGEIFQSFVLKRKYSIPWVKGIASSISDQILDWTTNLVVIFFGVMIFFLLKIALLPKKFALISFILFSFALFLVCYFYFKAFKKESIVEFLFRRFSRNIKNSEIFEIEKEVFNFFNFRKISFWKTLFIAFLEEIFLLLRIWLVVNFLGKSINFLSALSILAFSYLAMMVPVPAVLGIQEGVQVLTFDALKLGLDLGMAFALITRGADVILALIGMFISFKLGSELLKKKLFNS